MYHETTLFVIVTVTVLYRVEENHFLYLELGVPFTGWYYFSDEGESC